MKIEEQVVSLELAKKIKELNFKQESMFYWAKPKCNFYKDEHQKYNGFSLYINEPHFPYRYKNGLSVGGCGC